MGMSASQVRFLSLQSRKHDIGRELSTLSNRKMALSRDMNKVSQHYTNALNQKMLKWSNDSGATYQTLNYDLMMRPNDASFEVPYVVTDPTTGEVVLNNDDLGLKDKSGNPINLSYVDIAKMISSFSGVEKNATTGKPEIKYENAASYTDLKGNTHGQKAIENGYYIPDTTRDFSFANNLRYDIFLKMGLITQKDIDKTNNLLIQLYGSAEAEESGIYPVGSAYGDYYIAVAQLEAYNDYLRVQHPQALADTYGNITQSGTVGDKNSGTTLNTGKNSVNATAHDTYTDGNFTYDATIDGTRSATDTASIKQTGHTDTDSLSHVDFKSKLVETGGNYSVANTTTGDAIFGNYNVSGGYNSSELTANGLVSTYKEQGILLDGALGQVQHLSDYPYLQALSDRNNLYSTKYTGDYAPNDDKVEYNGSVVLLVTSGGKKGVNASSITNDVLKTNEDGGKSQCNWKHHKKWSEIKNDPLIQSYLGDMCDQFGMLAKIINKDYTNTECENAKSATIAYLIATCNNEYGDGDNKRCCENSRALAMASGHGLGAWGAEITGHVDHIAVAVDTAVAFDVYMTFLNAYHRGSVNSSTALPIITPTPYLTASTHSDSRENITATSWATGGIVTINEFTDNYNTNTDGSRGTFNNTFVHQAKYTIVSSEPTSGEYITIYKNGSSYSTEEHSGWTKVYATKNSGTEVSYYTNATSAGSSSTGVAGTSATTQTFGSDKVYGTVYTNNACYYFIKPEGVNQYLGTGGYTATNIDTIVANGNAKKISLTTSSTNIPITIDNDGCYQIKLADTFNASKYDTYLMGFYGDNDDYRRALEANVDAKKARITELENDLKNVFGGADQKLMDYYDALFQRIAENGWVVDEKTSKNNNANATEYLNNKLQNNDYFVTICRQKADETGYNYTTKLATTVTKIFEVNDDDAQNRALSQYETEKAIISNKETKIDVRMKKLETEQEAINTEMESVQKICNENIEKTFKIFA